MRGISDFFAVCVTVLPSILSSLQSEVINVYINQGKERHGKTNIFIILSGESETL